MNQTTDAKDFLYSIQKKKNYLSKKKGKKATLVGSLFDQRKNVLDLKILVCLDVSGSVSEAQFRQFMQQINLIRGLSVVKVLEVDTRVIALYDYFKTDQSQVMRLVGGGGTEFSEAFARAKELNPDAILFMTDGQVSGNIFDPGIPTGWILTCDGIHPYGFGEVVVKLPSPSNR